MLTDKIWIIKIKRSVWKVWPAVHTEKYKQMHYNKYISPRSWNILNLQRNRETFYHLTWPSWPTEQKKTDKSSTVWPAIRSGESSCFSLSFNLGYSRSKHCVWPRVKERFTLYTEAEAGVMELCSEAEIAWHFAVLTLHCGDTRVQCVTTRG